MQFEIKIFRLVNINWTSLQKRIGPAIKHSRRLTHIWIEPEKKLEEIGNDIRFFLVLKIALISVKFQ